MSTYYNAIYEITTTTDSSSDSEISSIALSTSLTATSSVISSSLQNITVLSNFLLTSDLPIVSYLQGSLVSETLTLSSSALSIRLQVILDTLKLSSSFNSSYSTEILVSEYFSLITSALLLFSNSITENIVTTSTLSSILTKVEKIIELIKTSTDINTKALLLNSLIDLIPIIAELGNVDHINESFALSSVISSILKSYNSIIESLILSTSETENTLVIISLSDNLLSHDGLITTSNLKSILSDRFIISIPTSSGQETYLSYLLSPETNSVSTFSNYNFDGCTSFGDKYLFYNSSGLFEYGGTSDDGALIQSKIQTVAYDFGTSNLKQIPVVYLGLTSTGSTFMKVRVDGRGECLYKLNKSTDGLRTQKVAIGKGLIGRYFQFELITTSSDFHMESIEFFPVQLKRKL